MAEWVGKCFALFEPLVEALGRYVVATPKLHADDTPVPVLDPGRGKTKTGRLWTYVRDDRPAGSEDPPAVLFRYSPDRRGERPREHLKQFAGILQADAYSGFSALFRQSLRSPSWYRPRASRLWWPPTTWTSPHAWTAASPSRRGWWWSWIDATRSADGALNSLPPLSSPCTRRRMSSPSNRRWASLARACRDRPLASTGSGITEPSSNATTNISATGIGPGMKRVQDFRQRCLGGVLPL